MEASPSTFGTFVPPSIEELAPHFPDYEIRTLIAKGGMGAVYKAKHRALDRPVALKILPSELGQHPELLSQFQQEAKLMARLNHNNLVSIFDFGNIHGIPFIIMEFINGKALYFSAHKKAIDALVSIDLTLKICAGIHHAHQAGIIHRDLKPANILLDAAVTPKIGDFGLSQTLLGAAHNTSTYGTPGYMAPEIYQKLPVDLRSDIFAVGCILYELLTGHPPKPYSYSLNTRLNPALDRIIQKATDPEPLQRYSSANEMAADLEYSKTYYRKPTLITTNVPSRCFATAPCAAIPATLPAHKVVAPNPIVRKSLS